MKRVNLWRSPSFKKTTFWGSASKTVDEDGWLSVTPIGKESYLGINMTVEGNTKYVFSVDVETPNETLNACQVYTATWVWLGRIDVANGRGLCRFTSPANGEIMFCFYGVGSSTTLSRRFRHPQLELASTYDTGVSSGGPTFFRWDTMPRVGQFI